MDNWRTRSFGHELTLTIDENLNKLKDKALASEKLKEANRLLKNAKLPN